MSQTLRDALKGFKRQALHAVRLGLIHPVTGEFMEWQAELPADATLTTFFVAPEVRTDCPARVWWAIRRKPLPPP